MEKIDIQDIKGEIWFGIITIRDDEFKAVLNQFKPRWIAYGENHYNIARIGKDLKEQYYVAIVRQPEQGHGDAQQIANNLIHDLNPKCLVVVGICGAKPEFEYTLGDVLVATRFRDFSVGAALPGGVSQHLDLGGPVSVTIQNAVANISAVRERLRGWNYSKKIGMKRPEVDLTETNFIGDEDWKAKVKDSLSRYFGEEQVRKTPIVMGVTLGSGNILQKDPEMFNRWLDHARDLKGVEMELPGVYRASRRKSGDIPVLGIRGISDIIGFKRGPNWTEYACRTAASFAFSYLNDSRLASALLQNANAEDNAKPQEVVSDPLRPTYSPTVIEARTAIERFGGRRTAFPSDHSINELENEGLLISPNFTTPTGQARDLANLAKKISASNHALVLGEPGAGKSVAIYKIALSLRNLGYQAIPIRFSDLRRIFSSSLPVERVLQVKSHNKTSVVLVDGLDEASVTESIGFQTICSWLEKLSNLFTVVISCRRAEFETYLSRYVAGIDFTELVNLNLWRIDVEFDKFVSRLVELRYLPDNSLIDLVRNSPMLRQLASRPLFARMLCNIGNVGVESISSVEDLYTRFFDGLATRTENSLKEGNCFLGTPVKAIWAESAWNAFKFDLLSDEALNFSALVKIISKSLNEQRCVSRALTQIIDNDAHFRRPDASYIHYSFYEFLLSGWILENLLDENQSEETLSDLFVKDLPRRVRHFFVRLLKKNDFTKVGQTRLLMAFQNLKSKDNLDESRAGCNLIVYVLSRVYACYPELRKFLDTEPDLFIRNSLFWGLAHSGDMDYTERFIKSLNENSEHLQMCRGYLLYYHGDLEIVDRPPFFDAPPFVSWERTKNAISEFMGTPNYPSTIRVSRRIVDVYTFMSFVKTRDELFDPKIAEVLSTCISSIQSDSLVAGWISRKLSEMYIETCQR